MAAVSEPVPITGKSNGSSSNLNVASYETAIEPATPVMPSQGLAMLEAIPRHKGEADFRILFDLPNATLLDAFSAALQLKSLLLHGRLYISSSAICFYSGVFGRKTVKVIRYDQMIGLYKRNTAKVFPNAIEIVTLRHKYFFCSFMFRDAAFRLAGTAWSDYLEASPSIDSHRINVNAKLDLELFIKRSTGEEQVKMIEEVPDEEASDSIGSSPPGSGLEFANNSPGSGKKLNDSGKSNGTGGGANAVASALPLSPGGNVADSSEDIEIDGDKKTSRKRKSGSRKSAAVGSTKRDSADFPELDSEEATSSTIPASARRNAGDSSPPTTRGSIAVVSAAQTNTNSSVTSSGSNKIVLPTSPTIPSSSGHAQSLPAGAELNGGSSTALKAKAVGFDLRVPVASQSTSSLDSLIPTASTHGSMLTQGNAAVTSSAPASGGAGQNVGSVSVVDLDGAVGSDAMSGSGGVLSSSSVPGASSSLVGRPEVSVENLLPEVPVSIPQVLNCKHIVEEADDKKFTGTKLGTRTYKNLTLAQFFALIWSNPEYSQLLISHFDYTEWNCPPWTLSETSCCAQRLLSYRMPLNATLGPKSTRVDSYQNARYKSPTVLLIETSNISKDVPMGDAFEVHEKWTILQDGPNVSLEVTAGVVWKKSAWGLKGTINQKSIEGVTENFEYVSKAIETTLAKFSASVASASSAIASPTAAIKKKKATLTSEEGQADDSSSSEDEKARPTITTKRKRRASRKGSKDGLYDHPIRDSAFTSNLTFSNPTNTTPASDASAISLIKDWKTLLLLILGILSLTSVAFLFFNMSTMSYRLHQMETLKGYGNLANHEEMNMRERIAFLEHLTTALLHNISDPGSYKSEQQKYWMAISDIDKYLVKTRSNVDVLQNTVHNLYQQRDQPSLSTSQVVDALRTLPIDRKVLSYLTNPEGFAQQLASVLTPPDTTFSSFESRSPLGSFFSLQGWSFGSLYLGLLASLAFIALFVLGKLLGFKRPF